jgi:hypothetical protein
MRIRKSGQILAAALVAIAVVQVHARSAAAAPLTVYSDALAQGWDDWSWDTSVDWSDTTSPHSGSADAAFTFDQPWAGLSMHSDADVDTSPYDELQFWINGDQAGGQTVSVEVEYPSGSASTPVDISPYLDTSSIEANTWSEATIPLTAIGADNSVISRIDLFDDTDSAQPTMLLDDVALINSGAKPKSEAVTVSIDATAGMHAISPYVYGVAFGGKSYLKDNGLTINRWGGNDTSRYNWRLGSAVNTASDWYFENTTSGNGCTKPGCAVDNLVRGDAGAGATSLITVPTLGWVAKDTSLDTCGFSVAKYGQQQAMDPYRPNCGNGFKPNGKPIKGNDPYDTSVQSTPADIGAWIDHLVTAFGPASGGGVRFFAMDNEPELWSSTHRDVHPKPLTYQGLYNEFETYATVVKHHDPSAMVTGPVPWGWSAYFDSAYDYAHNTTSDRQAHGGLPIIPWFLKQVRAHDRVAGQRTLDVLDIHFYPQGNNVFGGGTDPATDALRLRETRDLWDPTYTDESWINQPMDLIPLMHAWIKQYYPGTKLGISEWNFGADNTINGALAIADVLGIYGQQGLYYACYWTHPAQGSPGEKAFDMYRNYDGNGAQFGNTSVSTTTSTPSDLMAFSAIRSSDHALTVMLVNQRPDLAIQTTLNLAGYDASGQADLYRLGGSGNGIEHLKPATASSGMTVKLPPNSVELVVLHKK